jgi:hypothetical protein
MISRCEEVVSLGVWAPTEAAGNIPKFEARFSVAMSPVSADVLVIDDCGPMWATSGSAEDVEASPGTAVATASAETYASPPSRCALSKAPNRCSILSFHLKTTR